MGSACRLVGQELFAVVDSGSSWQCRYISFELYPALSLTDSVVLEMLRKESLYLSESARAD
jgi:hypothetical protein